MGSRARSTLILLAALVALGSYIWFVERKREPASPDARTKVFAGLDASQIEELTVRSSKGDTTVLRKQDGTWRIVSPLAAEVDIAEVSGITSGLATLQEERVVDEQAADLSAYGLAPARFEVSFKVAGEAEARRVRFGDRTPTGGDMYAALGDGTRVFLVQGFLDVTFDRSTFDLRDKAVLKLERDKLEGLEIRRGGETIAFAKADGEWRLTTPLAARADYGLVESLIGRIVTAQMKTIVADEAADLKAYGLADPDFSVSFLAGSARSTLLIGTRTPEGTLYARDASRPLVFTVDGTIADDLRKAPVDYRPKELFRFRSFTGARFEITRGDLRLVFEKRHGGDDPAPDKWVQVEPAAEKDEGRIIDLISAVSNLRATAFVDALPAGATRTVEVRATSEGTSRQETVVFYEVAGEVFAVPAGEPGAARLAATDFTEALKHLDALK